MGLSIPRSLVDHILLGPSGDRRQLQDSPILGDVWVNFAESPGKPLELLITPFKTETAGFVATEINDLIDRDRQSHPWPKATGKKFKPANIAYLQGVIAARLHFDELLRVVVPMTAWWKSSRISSEMHVYLDQRRGKQKLEKIVGDLVATIVEWSEPHGTRKTRPTLTSFERYAVLAGLILWAGDHRRGDPAPAGRDTEMRATEIVKAVTANNAKDEIVKGLRDVFLDILKNFGIGQKAIKQSLVYQVSLNRRTAMALKQSVPAVKADAARKVFTVECKDIVWAVVDSGIQGNHPAFRDASNKPRVQKAFDFSNYRKIVNLNNLRIFDQGADQKRKKETLKTLLHDRLKNRPSEADAIKYLTSLAQDARMMRPVHWEFVEPFVEIKVDTRPEVSDHGTHVAGIIGASTDGAKRLRKADQADFAEGMCPDIQLYDFRVLARPDDDPENDEEELTDTEFAIIAALQYIRHVNGRHDFITIHGANLSLSIPHDVHNYACGRTPVCVECERLIESGVVVVAAAGNHGYKNFETKEGAYESYAAFSITDPGNADGVITVGATHRYWPHTYGVSFFSSRGPTGDGRLKPDLVAPGERIRAPFREGWDDLDGTSMAAPHVSGAAAMLMARYTELIGQPRRIKQILCSSATDLGRERSFQGHGMLDVLRAFQSI